MSRNRNADKNRKKAAERERLAGRRAEKAAKADRRKGGIEAPERAEGAKNTDSRGHEIPTEAERRAAGTKLINIKDIRRAASEKGRRAGRMDTYSSAPSKRKRKVRYVLDKQAKKWLTKVLIIAAVIIAAAVIAIVALNGAEAAKKAAESSTITADETTQSLVGMTPEGKELVEGTGKFSGFAEIDGIDMAALYDHDMTAEEEALLASRGQQIRDGIVTYNANVSSLARQQADEAVQVGSAESGNGVQGGDDGNSNEGKRSGELTEVLKQQ